jgi:hypothetical protein
VPSTCCLDSSDELGIVDGARQEAIRSAVESGNHVVDGGVLTDDQNRAAYPSHPKTPAERGKVLAARPRDHDDVVVVGARTSKRGVAVGHSFTPDPSSCTAIEEGGKPRIPAEREDVDYCIVSQVDFCDGFGVPALTAFGREECHDGTTWSEYQGSEHAVESWEGQAEREGTRPSP